jgi:ribosomal protein L11 methylase PrmA
VSAATNVSARLLGRRFRFVTAPGLFSAERIDDGTRLLLEHLPQTAPASVLDVGCGYGALGLPIASRFPDAAVLGVDRDLLAVETALGNAGLATLTNVRGQGSLGYRDIGDVRFDWIVCNVPARIGAEAIRYLLGAGATRLSTSGELRVVVINDLVPTVDRIRDAEKWDIHQVAAGSRHTVFRLGSASPVPLDHEGIYARDRVEIPARGETSQLERPHDISEDPTHRMDALPLLLDCLPRQHRGGALVWRGGYGAAAIGLARAGARVVAADRDLLATTWTRRNALARGVSVETRDVLWPSASAPGPVSLAVCELSAAAGLASAQREVVEVLSLVSRGGTLLWLGLSKPLKQVLPRVIEQCAVSGHVLASRGSWSVAQLRVPS